MQVRLPLPTFTDRLHTRIVWKTVGKWIAIHFLMGFLDQLGRRAASHLWPEDEDDEEDLDEDDEEEEEVDEEEERNDP